MPKRPSAQELAKMLVTLHRFLPSSLSNIQGLGPKVHQKGRFAPGMFTRQLGTIGGVFGLKERGEEDAWINQLEQEDRIHQETVRNVAGAVGQDPTHQAAKHLAKTELNSILDEARHLAPQHVKTALINWKMINREKIDFDKKHVQALGEEQDIADAYDYSVETVPVTPFSDSVKYEYDRAGPKIDKRSKEYRNLKRRIFDNMEKDKVGMGVLKVAAAQVVGPALKPKGASKSATAATQGSPSEAMPDKA